MAQFEGSTHARKWLLSVGEVQTERERCHRRVCGALGGEEVLSLGEEELLLLHHRRRILRLLSGLNFPCKVTATALTYFGRFYLTRSVLEHNPSVVALLAVYAAAKVEEVLISAEELAAQADRLLNGSERRKGPSGAQHDGSGLSRDRTAVRVSCDVLLGEELGFLQRLDFNLICFHPYRSINFVAEQLKLDKALVRAAYGVVTNTVLLTDMVLTYTPAVVALAALQRSGADVSALSEGPGVRASVEAAVRAIEAAEGQLKKKGLDKEVLAELEARRRKGCLRRQDPCSEEGQRAKEEMEAQLEEQRLERDRKMERELQEREDEFLMGHSSRKEAKGLHNNYGDGVAKKLRLSLSSD